MAGLLTIGACMLLRLAGLALMAGSALAAGGGAGMALLVTHISAAVASLVWMVIEWKKFGHPSLVGIATGMVAGLATVTPARLYRRSRRYHSWPDLWRCFCYYGSECYPQC